MAIEAKQSDQPAAASDEERDQRLLYARNKWEFDKPEPLPRITAGELVRELINSNARSEKDRPADLAGYKLNEPKPEPMAIKEPFINAVLRQADLRWSDLWGSNLTGAQLYQARMQGSMLANADFTGADVTDADLRDANLGGANLEGAKGLRAVALAGAKLTNATLPAGVAKFERLARAEATIKNAQASLIAVIGACLYCWLTIANTQDSSLLTNTATTPLPVIQTAISFRWFYLVAPFIVLSMYVYLNIYLNRLWQDVSSLPTTFQDGEALDEKLDAWLLSAFIARHVFWLSVRPRRPLEKIEYALALFLAWALAPLTIIGFWARFLPVQSWIIWPLFVMGVAAIALAAYSLEVATATLKDGRSGYRQEAERHKHKWVFAVVLCAAALGGLTAMSRSPDHRFDWGPFRMKINIDGQALLTGAQSDARGANAARTDASVTGGTRTTQVGANLSSADLRHAHARGSDISGANLSAADLSGSNFNGAILTGANLRDARVAGASFVGADLANTTLAGVDLSKTDLTGANLSGACGDAKTVAPSEIELVSCR